MNVVPSLTFPDGYFERAQAAITRDIEENWELWTTSKRRYLFVSLHTVVEDDITPHRSGMITGRMEFHVTSDNLDYLRQLWRTPMFQSGFDSTVAHFIVDTKERKVVDLLSICA